MIEKARVNLSPFSAKCNKKIVVTERNNSNRKAVKHEHSSILRSFNR